PKSQPTREKRHPAPIAIRSVPATTATQAPAPAPTTTPSSSSSGSPTVAPPPAPAPAPAPPIILFADDFETAGWNGLNAGWDTNTTGGPLQTATVNAGHALQAFFSRAPVLGV